MQLSSEAKENGDHSAQRRQGMPCPHMSDNDTGFALSALDQVTMRANAVKNALLSQDYPNAKQALRRLQQITKDEALRTELTRCARSDFRCSGEPLLEGMEHGEALLSIAIGLANAAVCRRFLISPERAMWIRTNLQVRYPALFEWLDRFRRESIARGYAEYDGQRIYLAGIRSSDVEKKNMATESAIRWLVHY